MHDMVGAGDPMTNFLLVAFVFLLRAVCASEPAAPGGFYLDQQPVAVAVAHNIMFNPENFYMLPQLSMVAPLSPEDFALVLHGVSVQMHRIVNVEHGIWDEWMDFLQLPNDDPSIQQYSALYQYLWGAAGYHMIHPETKGLHVRHAVANDMGGGRVLMRFNVDPSGFMGSRLVSRIMLAIALLCFLWSRFSAGV